MTRSINMLALVGCLLGAGTACDDGVPTVSFADEPVVPGLDVDRGPATLTSPLTVSAGGDDRGSDEEGQCSLWELRDESYNPENGEFSNHYVCVSGGDIASYTTVGKDNFDGTGHYTQTRVMRDGTTVVWEFTFLYALDGSRQSFQGTSSLGESYVGTYLYDQYGQEHVTEEWNLVEGTYKNDGTFVDDDLFVGTRTFDDPGTDASPDWAITLEIDEGGSFVQTVEQTTATVHRVYTYVVNPDGTAVYSFENDVLQSEASPDFEGGYNYNPDGSGAGTYLQRFDDGSTTLVEDTFSVDGALIEAWTFDDARTPRLVDQTGQLTYSLNSMEGAGHITWVLDDGNDQRCDLFVNDQGATTIANCAVP